MEKKKYLPNIEQEEFLHYLQEKGCNHRSYKMYSTIDIVNSTIDNKALYLSSGYNWNDKVDRECFNNENLIRMNFGRCFSYSTTESVAMWMLYGGTKHRGAMIDFNKCSMLEILRNTKRIEVGYFEESGFKKSKVLRKEDFEIQLIDVVYTEKKDSTFIIKRSTGDKWEITNQSEKNILGNEKYSFIHKNKAWDYEQECRLIISIRKELLEDLLDYDKINAVKIDLQGIDLEGAKRICAPNISKEDRSKPEFVKTNPSDLLNEVDWDLCLNCHSY